MEVCARCGPRVGALQVTATATYRYLESQSAVAISVHRDGAYVEVRYPPPDAAGPGPAEPVVLVFPGRRGYGPLFTACPAHHLPACGGLGDAHVPELVWHAMDLFAKCASHAAETRNRGLPA